MSRQSEEHKDILFKTWGQQGFTDGQFNYPTGMVVGYDGTIYVSDSSNHRIQCFDSNGNFIHNWGRKGTANGEFIFPSGLTIGLNETKTGVDSVGGSIMAEMCLVPELSLYPWRNFKTRSRDLPSSGLLSMCIEYIGIEQIYVVDSMNNRIQMFDTSSSIDGSDNVKFVRMWGTKGDSDGQFQYPTACAISRYGLSSGKSTIYVTDTFNHRIQVFDHEGRFIWKWGSKGDGDYQFNHPMGICSSYNTRDSPLPETEVIYIADKGNNRVVCYEINLEDIKSQLPKDMNKIPGSDSEICSSGTKTTSFGEVRYIFGFLGTHSFNPIDVMVDGNALKGVGVVYVVDCEINSIRKFGRDGLNEIKLIQSLGSYGSGHFNKPYAIAKGITKWPDGTPVVYIADTYNNRIAAIKF